MRTFVFSLVCSEFKTEKEVFEWLKKKQRKHWTYVGKTFSDMEEAFPLWRNFHPSLHSGRYRSQLQEAIFTQEVRAFQVAVVKVGSEEEARHLEEYIVVRFSISYFIQPI